MLPSLSYYWIWGGFHHYLLFGNPNRAATRSIPHNVTLGMARGTIEHFLLASLKLVNEL